MDRNDSSDVEKDIEKDVEITSDKIGPSENKATPGNQPEYPPLSKVLVILLALYLAVFLVIAQKLR